MLVVLGTIIEVPDQIRIGFASVFLGNRPGPGQRVIDRSDLVEKNVLVLLIQVDSLFDNRATIIVLREPLWGVSRVTSDAATPVPG